MSPKILCLWITVSVSVQPLAYAQTNSEDCRATIARLNAEESDLNKTKLDCYNNSSGGSRMNCRGLSPFQRTDKTKDINSRLSVIVEQSYELSKSCGQPLGAQIKSRALAADSNRGIQIKTPSSATTQTSIKISNGPQSF